MNHFLTIIFIIMGIKTEILSESNVLQYFGNIRHSLAAPNSFAEVVKVLSNHTQSKAMPNVLAHQQPRQNQPHRVTTTA